MSKESKVSVIIPTYNAESFIERCINSVLNQTYKNVELIIVDDGSEDKTFHLIKDKYNKYKNIKLFKQKNSGVSVARNKGIELAEGDYCVFLDADDWLEINAIEILLKKSYLHDGSFIICDYYRVKILNGKNYKTNNNLACDSTICVKDAIMNFEKYKLISACYKLYNLDIIKSNNIVFPVNIHYGEDGLFVFRYLQHIDNIFYLSMCLWNCAENPKSVTHAEFNIRKLTGIKAAEMMLNENFRYNTQEINESLKRYIFKRIIAFANNYIVSSKKNDFYTIFFRRKIKQYLKYSFKHNNLGKTELLALANVFTPYLLASYLKLRKQIDLIIFNIN